MNTSDQVRTYTRAESVVFLKTTEPFGGLSNMAGGYPIRVNGIRILTSEALYQACRFPHLPEVQRMIIGERSPMTAKMKGKPYRGDSRPDWDRVRVGVMRWCLRIKLVQHWAKFSQLLLSTGERPIVEESRKDAFWGSKPVDEQTLVGMNVLGRLLMELREVVKRRGRHAFQAVEPLGIPEFLLLGCPIEPVVEPDVAAADAPLCRQESPGRAGRVQGNLFACAPGAEARAAEADREEDPAVVRGTVMIANLSPYPDSKESGQAWLGRVPNHWMVLPNRALFCEVNDRGHVGEEMLSVTINRGIIHQKSLLTDSSKKDSSRQDKSAYKLVQPFDIAYNKMRAWQGAIGVSDLRGIISPAYIVMRLRQATNVPRYYHYLFRTPYFAKEAERWSYGITSDMWSLRPEHFRMIYTPQPSPDEQAAIVRFLDYATGRLERAIRAKRKVIALLQEQKQAVIHRAVTRGLDPSVPLKPTGVPWLGDIPHHWEVTRIKNEFLCLNTRRVPLNAVERGAMTSKNFDYYGASGVIDKVDGYLFDDELILIAEDGANLVLRNLPLAIIARGKFWVNNHAHILKPKCGSIIYLAHLLETVNYGPWISGAAQPKLTQDRLLSIAIAVAPSREQEQIVQHVSELTQPLAAAITRIGREIDLLRECCTRLVADVVTGKLDVRYVAARLPCEAKSDLVESDSESPDDTGAADEELAFE